MGAAPDFVPICEFYCVHRGPIDRYDECELCGAREEVAAVHQCTLKGFCTIHAHGIRRGGKEINRVNLLPCCISCPDRNENGPPDALHGSMSGNISDVA